MTLRYLTAGLMIWAALAPWLPTPARAADGVEAVTDFNQTAVLNHDGALAITTDIAYDFGGAAPHDITFELPLTYHNDQGRDFRINFALGSATTDGRPVTLQPVVTPTSAKITLPAGTSAQSTRQYVLKYRLSPVIVPGDTADILRLSVTGRGWTAPINRAALRLEAATAPGDILCYTGSEGMTTGGCTVTQQDKVATVTTDHELPPGTALSIAGDFPQHSFAAYLEPHEDSSSALVWFIGAGVLALAVIVALQIAIVRFRRHTKTNESA